MKWYFIYLKYFSKDRLKDFWGKLEEAKNINMKKNASKLDKEASGRMIRNILSRNNVEKFNSTLNTINENDKEQKRKVKGSVPIPIANHLNWEKDLK